MDNRWTPVLSPDGEFYCSPACGGGRYCRKSWFDHATSAAAALALRMGPGWEPKIWENLGWRYKARKPFGKDAYADIREQNYPAGAPSYRAEIKPGTAAGAVGLKGPHGPVKCTLQFFGEAADPHRALAQARAHMDAEAAALAAAFARAESILDGEAGYVAE